MQRAKWKVLAIDTDEGLLDAMRAVMEEAGYEVWTSATAEEGIRLCQVETFQVVITEIDLPGWESFEVARRVKEMDPDPQVIVTTSHVEIEYAIGALRLDASDFLTKPFPDQTLLVALDRAKKRHTTRTKLHDYAVLLEESWMETADELSKMILFQENLIDSSIDGIMACDSTGTTVTFNQSMEAMLGYSQEEVCGNAPLGGFFEEGEAKAFFEKLRSEQYGGKNRLLLYETNLVGKSGEKVPVQPSATVLFEGDKEIGTVVVFRDLRELRKLEQEYADQSLLLRQDKMISLGRLAASVVHEINNPLSGILNYVRLMIKILNRGALTPDAVENFQRYLALIESETSRCSQIVSSLLAFSRESRMRLGETDIGELLQKCVLLSQHKMDLQNIQVKTCLDPGLPKVWGDFNQIQQCVINLLFNAMDAMPQGGELTIGSSMDFKEKTVHIRVEDTGCGIPEEDIGRIFDPFFSRGKKGKGVGLGLSTVYGIVQRHRGSVEVRSELGKGSVFTIKLPVERVEK